MLVGRVRTIRYESAIFLREGLALFQFELVEPASGGGRAAYVSVTYVSVTYVSVTYVSARVRGGWCP